MLGPPFDYSKHTQWTESPDHVGGVERCLWNTMGHNAHVYTISLLPFTFED